MSSDLPVVQTEGIAETPPRAKRLRRSFSIIPAALASCIDAAGGSGPDQTVGARQMTGDIDLLDAERMVAQTECDDIDTAMAQIAADDADAKAKLAELSERRKIAGERLSRISTALTEARSGSAG